jgi:hypothetical protein
LLQKRDADDVITATTITINEEIVAYLKAFFWRD